MDQICALFGGNPLENPDEKIKLLIDHKIIEKTRREWLEEIKKLHYMNPSVEEFQKKHSEYINIGLVLIGLHGTSGISAYSIMKNGFKKTIFERDPKWSGVYAGDNIKIAEGYCVDSYSKILAVYVQKKDIKSIRIDGNDIRNINFKSGDHQIIAGKQSNGEVGWEMAIKDGIRIKPLVLPDGEQLNSLQIPKTDVLKIAIKQGKFKNADLYDPGNVCGLGKVLNGIDIDDDSDIDGINTYFSKYTLEGIKNMLKLRLQDADIDAKILEGNYFFMDKDSNNIGDLLTDLTKSKSTTTLVPISLYGKHAVGIIFVNNKAYYIDPENHGIPFDLEEMLLSKYNIEQLLVEAQKYTNCGPEVIEDFMLYLTGERFSQENAIMIHNQLFENNIIGLSGSIGKNAELCHVAG